MNRRVKGFTILEISIAMLIASMVIGITYTAYLIIGRAYQSYNSKHEHIAELLKLDELLRKDFDHAELILKDTGGIAIHYPTCVIKYRFDTAFILRITIKAD